MFIVYLVHQVYCIHCGIPLQRRVPVGCLYHYSQERLVVCSLATAKGVHTSGGNLTVKFIYLIKGPGAYGLPKVVECSTVNFRCTDVEK